MKGNWKSSLIFTQQEKAEYVGNQQLLIDPSENWGHQQTDWSPTNWRDRLVTTENYNSLERSLGAGSITEPSIWVGEPHLVKHWGLRMNACMLSQSCPALCDPRDCSPPGCSVPGILQARILDCVPFPTPGDLPSPGIEPVSLASPALAGGFFTTAPSQNPQDE